MSIPRESTPAPIEMRKLPSQIAAFIRSGELNARARELLESRLFMGMMLVLAIILYLWYAPRGVDLAVWDESTYFNRGYDLYSGNLVGANLGSPLASPLWVCYYALWYAVLRTPVLYPWILSSSIALIGIGAYLLLTRLFPPALGWLLAVAIVIGTAPIVPGNACYYFGAGALWCGLSLLGRQVWRRGLAAFLVLLTGLIRPEFFTCAALLGIFLAIYELRAWRLGRVQWRVLATSYVPLVMGLGIVAYIALTMQSLGYDRVSTAIPWSYNNWYLVTKNPAFQGFYSLQHTSIIFEKDFGHVQSWSLPSILLAMLRNPAQLGAYLVFEAQLLWASIGNAVQQCYGWRYDQSATSPTQMLVTITPQNTWVFAIGVGVFGLFSLLCWRSLRRAQRQPALGVRLTATTWFAYLSLASLLIWLLLVVPSQRFFMIYPVLLAPVGYGLWCIVRRIALPAWSLLVLMVMVLVGIPHPFANMSVHPVEATVGFLRTYVPNHSTVLTPAATSYSNYLEAVHFNLQMMETGDYPQPMLVNAFEANPALTYLLIAPSPTESYSEGDIKQWFADWNKAFPNIPWELAIQQQRPSLRLYKLPKNSGRRYGYQQMRQQVASLGMPASTLPAYAAIDFKQNLTWQSATAPTSVTETYQKAWGLTLKSVIMHPAGQGVDPTVPHTLTTQLSASWSGGTLAFAAALAPWAANQPGANGTQLVFSIPGTTFSQTVQVPDTYPNQHWVPIALHLPRLPAGATLRVTILPRTSLLYDTTLFSFLGFAPAGGSGADA